MARPGKNARAIDAELARRGVPESRRKPYRTSARMLYSALLDKHLKGRFPVGREMDEAERNCLHFVQGFWGFLREANSSPDLRVMNSARIIRSWNGGYALNGTRTARPLTVSTVTDDLSISYAVEGHEAAFVRDRARNLIGEAATRISSATGTVDLRMDGKSDADQIRMVPVILVVDGSPNQVHSWNVSDLLHLADEDLLGWVGQIAERILEGRATHAEYEARSTKADECLRSVEEGCGLPIRLEIRPTIGGKGSKDRIDIVLHGYTPSGRQGSYRVKDLHLGEIYRGSTPYGLQNEITRQRILHERFGPSPGTRPVEWEIDMPTARRLACVPDAAEIVGKLLSSEHKAIRAGDIELRIDGTCIHGKFDLDDRTQWLGNRLTVIGMELPDMLRQGLRGRRISEIVQGADLSGGGIIVSVKADQTWKKPRATFNLRPDMISVDAFAEEMA